VASDAHMLLYGWARPIMSQNSLRLRQMMMVWYVQLKNVRKHYSNISSRQGRPRLHVSPLSCQSIVHRPLDSFPPPLPLPPLLLPSPTNEPMVPDVNMCRSNLKRNKSKTLRDFGCVFKFCLAAKSATSKVTRVAVYCVVRTVYKVLALFS
jgi:hypothetical protein